MSASKQLTDSKHNGLAAWRERQAEARRLRLMELEHYRQFAEQVERDGRTYTLVRIPDRYDSVPPAPEPQVQLRGRKNRKAA